MLIVEMIGASLGDFSPKLSVAMTASAFMPPQRKSGYAQLNTMTEPD